MNANVATANRLLASADVLDAGEDMSASMDIGDRLLLVFAGFIAVVFGLSGLALLVISSAVSFE